MLIILKHGASGSLLVYLWRLDLRESSNRLFSELSNPGSQGNRQSHTSESYNSPTSIPLFPLNPSWNGRFMQTALCVHFPARICPGHMSSAQIIKLIINWDWRKQVVSSLPTWLCSQLSKYIALTWCSAHITNLSFGHKNVWLFRCKSSAGKQPHTYFL